MTTFHWSYLLWLAPAFLLVAALRAQFLNHMVRVQEGCLTPPFTWITWGVVYGRDWYDWFVIMKTPYTKDMTDATTFYFRKHRLCVQWMQGRGFSTRWKLEDAA